jgi:hypothetical protein
VNQDVWTTTVAGQTPRRASDADLTRCPPVPVVGVAGEQAAVRAAMTARLTTRKEGRPLRRSGTVRRRRRMPSGRCLPGGSTSLVKTRRSVSPGVRRASRSGPGAVGSGNMSGLLLGSQAARGRKAAQPVPTAGGGPDQVKPKPTQAPMRWS